MAIVKNAKAKSKALDTAMQKQGQKQVHDTVCIDKPNNNITIEQINNLFSFDEFWDLYDKKSDKKKCKEKYEKLSLVQIEKIKVALPIYIKSKPDIQYRKNPLTWLNGECWNDEVKLKEEIIVDEYSHLRITL